MDMKTRENLMAVCLLSLLCSIASARSFYLEINSSDEECGDALQRVMSSGNGKATEQVFKDVGKSKSWFLN